MNVVFILSENFLEFFLQGRLGTHGFDVIVHVGTLGDENIDMSGNMVFVNDFVDALSHITVPSEISGVQYCLSVALDFEHVGIGR